MHEHEHKHLLLHKTVLHTPAGLILLSDWCFCVKIGGAKREKRLSNAEEYDYEV